MPASVAAGAVREVLTTGEGGAVSAGIGICDFCGRDYTPLAKAVSKEVEIPCELKRDWSHEEPVEVAVCWECVEALAARAPK